MEAVGGPTATRPPLATTVDQRTRIVIHGVEYPEDPRDMTPDEIREHLFLPAEATIEVLDHQNEGGVTEVGISWAESVNGEIVLDHLRRIVRERVTRIA